MSRNDRQDLILELQKGKVPPSAVEFEEMVLGALMLDKNAMALVVDILKPHHFYKDAHMMVFKAIEQLYYQNKPVDMATVTLQLRTNGILDKIGGPFFITELTKHIVRADNIEYHAQIIVQTWIGREIITIASRAVQSAYENTTDVFELLTGLETNLGRLTSESSLDLEEIDFVASLKEVKKLQIDRQKNNIEITGIPTGNKKLDKYTSGWQNGHLIILAARAAMGKTAKALKYAKVAAQNGNPVALFSMEMPGRELVKRFIIEESDVWSSKFKEGTLTDSDFRKIDDAIFELQKLPIYICDRPAINANQMRAFIRKINRKNKRPVELVIVDYLQLQKATEKKETREQEIANITGSLKAMAKELNVPVIALSQVGRQVEQRQDKRPMLSDLREGGSIENDADMVIFQYRPSYYSNYGNDKDPEYQKDKISEEEYNMTSETIVAKHRDGDTGVIKERFHGPTMKYLPAAGEGVEEPDLFTSTEEDTLPF